ncbi:MAG: NAD-dependent epimerase/dehydratase family protein [Paracoccaceae bacterium]
MKKVGVLGSDGFLGKWVSDTLSCQKGIEVIDLSRRHFDLGQRGSLKRCLDGSGVTCVVNCVAQVGSVHFVNRHAADVFVSNCRMSLNLYEDVRETGCNWIINPISNCCFPEFPGKNEEGAYENGKIHSSVAGYGYYKRMLINLSEVAYKQWHINTTNLMFPSLFGPWDSLDPDKSHALNGIIARALKNKRDGRRLFEIWGSGQPIRDWLYVGDAANAIATIVDSDHIDVEPINVTAENHCSVTDIARIVLSKLDPQQEITFNRSFQDGVLEKVLMLGRFSKLFPDFVFTKFDEGIGLTIDNYSQRIR